MDVKDLGIWKRGMGKDDLSQFSIFMDFCCCLTNECQGGEGYHLPCKLLHGPNSLVVALGCPTSEHTHIKLPSLYFSLL